MWGRAGVRVESAAGKGLQSQLRRYERHCQGGSWRLRQGHSCTYKPVGTANMHVSHQWHHPTVAAAGDRIGLCANPLIHISAACIARLRHALKFCWSKIFYPAGEGVEVMLGFDCDGFQSGVHWGSGLQGDFG